MGQTQGYLLSLQGNKATFEGSHFHQPAKSHIPLGKSSSKAKSFKKWTQTNALIDLAPLSEKIGQEIKSSTMSLVSGLCLLPD